MITKRRKGVAGRVVSGLVCLVVMGLLLLSLISFETVRSFLDAQAGDGAAEPYTLAVHRRIQFGCIVLGGMIACVALGLRYTAMRNTAISQHCWRRFRRGVFLLIGRLFVSVRREWSLLLLLVCVAAVVRYPYLTQPLRYDEAYSYLAFSSRPLYVTVSDYNDPNNHVFHNVLVSMTSVFAGNREWALRIPAFIAGLLIVPVSFLIASRCGGRISGILAGVIAATSSVLIEYSALARGYSLVCLMALLCLAFVVSLSRRRNPAAEMGLIIAAVLGMWTVPTFLYAVVPLTAGLCITRYMLTRQVNDAFWQFCRLWFGIAVGCLIVYLPVLLVSGPQPLVANRYVVALGTQEFLAAIIHWPDDTARFFLRDVPIVVGIVWLLGIGRVFTGKSYEGIRLVWSVVPALMLIPLMATIQRVIPPGRGILFLVPIAIVGVGIGWGQILQSVSKEQLRRLWTAGLIAIVGVWPLVVMVNSDSILHSDAAGPFDSANTVAEYLASTTGTGDYVVAIAPCSSPLIYYGDRVGLSRDRFLIPERSKEHSVRLIVVVSNTGPTPTETLESLGLLQLSSGNTWNLLQEYPDGSMYEMILDPLE